MYARPFTTTDDPSWSIRQIDYSATGAAVGCAIGFFSGYTCCNYGCSGLCLGLAINSCLLNKHNDANFQQAIRVCDNSIAWIKEIRNKEPIVNQPGANNKND